MQVLLTGVTGFLGSHVARELLGRGHEVLAHVRSGSNRSRIESIQDRLHLFDGDPVEGAAGGVDALIHLAWYTVPGKYLHAPENKDCYILSRRLLDAVQGRAVFSGTCFEFDTRLGLLRDDSPTLPTTLYATCKDDLRHEVCKRPNSVWARLFYLYGPYEDERRFVPSVIGKLRRGEPVALSPGDQRRDYMHVEDAAAALVDVTERGLQGTVNIGTGEAPSIREIVSQMATFVGSSDLLRWGEKPYYEGEPMLIQADNSKLRSTGWKARYDLKEGLRDTVRWWLSR